MLIARRPGLLGLVLALAAVVVAGFALPQRAAAGPPAADARSSIAIGFNGADITGDDAQPQHITAYYAAQRAALGQYRGSSAAGQQLCHAYVSWDIGLEPAGSGSDVVSNGLPIQASRAWLQKWLQAYQDTCDQALITFKWVNGVSCHYYTGCHGGTDVQALPDPAEVGASLKAFLSESWPGWTGSFAFTPWNEPNATGTAASGFTNGALVPAETDADYYLAMRQSCTPAIGCQIAAGDLNSNGNHYQDFVQHCADDSATLCDGATYMDTLKHTLDADATAYGFPTGFRPEYFAYHAWSDANDYLHTLQNPGATTTCQTLTDPLCVTRLTYDALSTALYPANASWNHVTIWDTEVGAGQNGNTFNTSPTPDQQGQTMAFVFGLTTSITDRITRLYYTRAWEPDGQWWSLSCSDGVTPKPVRDVLIRRATSYTPTGFNCDGATGTWSVSTVYREGDEVTYDGAVWLALWWTRGQQPGNPYGPWQEMATATDGSVAWTPSRVFAARDLVEYDGVTYTARWWTRNQKPGDPYGPWRPLG